MGLADLGTAAVLFLSAALVFMVAGLDRRFISIAVAVGMIAGVGLVIQKPYRLKRVISSSIPQYKLLDRIDPQGRVKNYMNQSLVAKDTNYQVEQSKIAVGSGGVDGSGSDAGQAEAAVSARKRTRT